MAEWLYILQARLCSMLTLYTQWIGTVYSNVRVYSTGPTLGRVIQRYVRMRYYIWQCTSATAREREIVAALKVRKPENGDIELESGSVPLQKAHRNRDTIIQTSSQREIEACRRDQGGRSQMSSRLATELPEERYSGVA